MFIINMIKCICTALLMYFSLKFVRLKEIYEIKADDLIDTMLANAYKGKFQLGVPTRKVTTKMAKSDKTSREPTTTRPTYAATKHTPKIYQENLTKEEFVLRQQKLNIKRYLETNIDAIPNFDVDEISVQKRRFDKELNSTDDNILRQHYFNNEDRKLIYKEKGQILALMEQFVYRTRYELEYSQLLRKKYKNNIKYRLGYCFALMRTLKQQQMVIFSSLKASHEGFMSLFIHLKLYEKVVKLDVDIKDLIKFIEHLNEVRKKEAHDRTSTTRKKRS